MNYFITPITLCGIHPCFRFIIHFRWKSTCAYACMCVCKCEYIWVSIKIELLNWDLFLWYEMIIIHHFSWGHSLGLNRRQAITWHNDNPVSQICESPLANMFKSILYQAMVEIAIARLISTTASTLNYYHIFAHSLVFCETSSSVLALILQLSRQLGAYMPHWTKLTFIGWDDGLLPVRCQAIIWSTVDLLPSGTWWTNFSGIWNKTQLSDEIVFKCVVCKMAVILLRSKSTD